MVGVDGAIEGQVHHFIVIDDVLPDPRVTTSLPQADEFTLADVQAATALLREANVPPAADGNYYAVLPRVYDAVFQDARSSADALRPVYERMNEQITEVSNRLGYVFGDLTDHDVRPGRRGDHGECRRPQTCSRCRTHRALAAMEARERGPFNEVTEITTPEELEAVFGGFGYEK